MSIDYQRICYGCLKEKPSAEAICPACGFDASAPGHFPLALPLGSILAGRYLVGKPLGQGGFGITYLAFDLLLHIKVAIKEFLPSGMVNREQDHTTVSLLSIRNEQDFNSNKDKFLDEARILAQLSDVSNIVKVQNYFLENNTAYFAMEYISGQSLKAIIDGQGGRLPWRLAGGYLLPIAEALEQVHAQNLLHRDISPDNISVTDKGKSILLDFGAARVSMGDARTMSVILKHGFAPEEQYRSRGNQGPWTDVYGLAATLYYSLTGSTPPESIDRLHQDTIVPPRQLGSDIPPVAEAALMKALAVHAEHRFSNMRAFADALLGKTPVSAPPVAPATAGAAIPPTAPVVPVFSGGQAAGQGAGQVHSSGPGAIGATMPVGSSASPPPPGMQATVMPHQAQDTGGEGYPSLGAGSSSRTGMAKASAGISGILANKKLLIIAGAALVVIIVVIIILVLALRPSSEAKGSGTTGTSTTTTTTGPGGSGSTSSGAYTAKELPFSFVNPEGWTIDDTGLTLSTRSTSGVTHAMFGKEFKRSMSDLKNDPTLHVQDKATLFGYGEKYTLKGAKEVTSGANTWYMIEFTLNAEDGTPKYLYRTYFYQYNASTLYSVYLSTPATIPDGDEAAFNKMIESVTWSK